MRKVIARQWYRVDKATAQLLAVNNLAVVRAATGNFDNAQDVLKTGRFQTPYAVYSRGDLLTDTEKIE